MSDHERNILYHDAVGLLRAIIATPSFSKAEEAVATLLTDFLQLREIPVHRVGNNIWAKSKKFVASRPTILLNSHIDTVKPGSGYTRDPFAATIEQGKLYGLGSNDAGGCLVALLATFLYYYDRGDDPCNLIFAASAEEEISGAHGMEALLKALPPVDSAIVGEPTKMQMAVAEKGLLVVDCTVPGITGHAARNEGENAIYNALSALAWFRQYQFPKVSSLLGPVKMSVTIINAGTQHNVVPAACTFTVDIRLNDCYTHQEVLDTIRENVKGEVTARSTRLKPTAIPANHPLVVAGHKIGLPSFGSSTMSDKALMPFPALKIGPGDSARSHMADEYIYTDEIRQGIDIYIKLLGMLG